MPRALLRLAILLLALFVAAGLLERLAFGLELRARAWDRTEARVYDARLGYRRPGPVPGLDLAPDGPPAVVVLETEPLDPARQHERRRRLHDLLADDARGPARLRLLSLPGASMVQRVLLCEPIPAGTIVLCVTLADLAREAVPTERGWPGTRILAGPGGGMELRVPGPGAGGPGPALLARIPLLRLLGAELGQRLGPGRLPTGLWPLVRDGVPDEAERLNGFERALRWTRDRVTAAGGRLCVLYLPTALEVDEEERAAFLADFALDSARIESTRPSGRVVDLCRVLDIVCIDGTPQLRRSGRRNEPMFAEGPPPLIDHLLTPRAEQLLALALARSLPR